MAFPTQSLDLEVSSSQYATDTPTSGFPTGSTDKTIEAWVKFETLPTSGGTMFIVDFGTFPEADPGGNGKEFSLAIKESSGSYFGFVDYYNGGVTGSVNLGFTTGTWYHFAVHRTGGNFVWFVGGTQIDSAGVSGGTGGAGDIVGVGGRVAVTVPNPQFDGKISLTRIWAEARSGAQLLANQCTVLGSTTNLAAEWTFDNVYTDNSGNGNTLTPVAAPTFGADVPATCAVTGPANLKSLDTNVKANIKSYNTNVLANIKSINTNA